MNSRHNNTSENVLRMFKFILQKEKFTLQDIICHFAEFGLFFEQETILKYIRTLKKAGFGFEKTNAKTYKLTYVPLHLINAEISVLKDVFEIINNDFSQNNTKTAEKFLRFFPETLRVEMLHSLNKNSILPQKLKKYFLGIQNLLQILYAIPRPVSNSHNYLFHR